MPYVWDNTRDSRAKTAYQEWCAFHDCPIAITTNQAETINPYNYSTTIKEDKE